MELLVHPVQLDHQDKMVNLVLLDNKAIREAKENLGLQVVLVLKGHLDKLVSQDFQVM